MTIVFVRHADDNVSKPTYSHDPRITKYGEKKAQRAALELVDRYGCPDIIFCSPFRRTIRTAKAMKKICGFHTDIFVDNNLSRYFCSREKVDPQIDPGTEKYDAPIYESWSEFEDRIDKHLKMLKHTNAKSSGFVIWCITHALVYKHVARTFTVEIPTFIPFMDHFLIHEHSVAINKKECKKKRKQQQHKKRKHKKRR